MGARTGRTARPKANEAWRVTYQGKTNLYESKAGVNAKIRGLLSTGADLNDITIQVTPTTWDASPEYDNKCFVCKEPLTLPNDNCKLQQERVRRKVHFSGTSLPHPQDHIIGGM